MILDATCAPADIRYPTDVSLLNEAREKLDDIIDTLHQPLKGIEKKPRTDRKKARKEYLGIAKLRKWTAKKVRKAVGKQLTYVKRNLKSVDSLLTKVDYNLLSNKQKHDLEVIRKLYSQQQYMYQNKVHRVDNRIVSISQPHVRPIVRGKQKAEVEFGAKVAVSLVDGYAFVDYLNWNNYNESSTLKDAVEKYRERFGYYPEAILADTIYRTRENINYCKQLGIRLSGPKLGRPSKAISKELRKIEYLDSCKRNAIEGKFGEGKRSYGLQRIMTRLKETSETVIVMQFFVMNLGRKLRVLFAQFFEALFQRFFMLDLPNFAYINC